MKRINPHLLFVGSFIPNWLMRRNEILPITKLTYARLCQYAGKDGECYPAQETLASELGVSVDTIARSIKQLVELKLIESVQRGFKLSNSYFFLDHPWMHEGDDNRNLRVPESAPVQGHETASMPVPEVASVPPQENQKEENQSKREPSAAISKQSAEKSDKRKLTDGWCERFLRVMGQKYAFSGVKDALAADRLLKLGLSVEEILEIAERAWRLGPKNAFERKMAISLATFSGQFNGIRLAVGALKKATHVSDHDFRTVHGAYAPTPPPA